MGIGRYECPQSVEAAVELLVRESGRSAVLAGGTDLIADVRAGRQVDLVVDIKKIPELNQIRWERDGTLRIGACVCVQAVAEDARIAARYPALTQAVSELGSYQVRCRATIAGNLGNASPCADVAPALLVLDARIVIASPDGSREEQPLDGFIRDVKKTALKRGQIITTIVIPPLSAQLRSAFLKIKRITGHDLALVNAAAAYDPESNQWRLAIGSAACTPVLVRGLETLPDATIDEIGAHLAEKAVAQIKPIDDVRASAEYRRDMTALLCRRLAATLAAGGDHE